MRKKILPIALLLIFVLAGCSPLLRGGDGRLALLRRSADRYLRSVYLKGSSWSIMAVDLESGRILLNCDADRTLIPASSLKLLTTACALETLGPDYRIATHIGYTGEIDSSGVLHGNLTVIGGGDPTISTRQSGLWPTDVEKAHFDDLDAWVDSIVGRGVRVIDGNVAGYSGLFGPKVLGSSWEWDDLKYGFAAEIDPLIHADNCIEVTIIPGDSAGAPAGIAWSPETEIASFYSDVITAEPGGDPEIYFDRTLEGNVITVWGSIPQDFGEYKLWVAVYDADRFFISSLSEALTERGIEIRGTTLTSRGPWPGPDEFHLLFTHLSPPLGRIIQVINRDSQNLYAEVLIRILGVEMIRRGEPAVQGAEDAFQAGRDQVKLWESRLAGASTGFALVDGSGLSRRNLISASGLIKVLVYMNRSPYCSDFIRSLATPGQGTLELRFQGLPTGINLHAKTGSLARVRSLSGYLSTEEGVQIAFSFICNHYLCEPAEVEQTMENLCQLLALYLKEGAL